jgi:hypothetical protein
MRPSGRSQASVLLWLFVSCTFLISQPAPAKRLVVSAVQDSKLSALPLNTHPLARAQFDVGVALSNLPMQRMLLVLKRSPEQEHALAGRLDQLQDKNSPFFHKWLTPEQFGEEFGPADADIQAVTTWLESHGFQVAEVSKGRTVIEFSGTASQVQSAFHTSIHKYVVDGEEHWANSSDPQIPTALTPVVAGVATLHNFFKKPMLHMSPEPIATNDHGKIVPNSTFSGDVHALTPGDYATIYNIKPLYQAGIDGTGRSIAVVGRTEINPADVLAFQRIFDIFADFQVVYDGPGPTNLGGGEEAEAILDSTWSSSIAPGATTRLVVSASTNTTDGVDLSELYIIDHNLADVMTESFGSCEAFYTQADADFTANMAKQAAAQGITYLVSTGDSGASGCDRSSTSATGPLSVNILASSPYTIAVGGTMFNEHGQAASYWNPAPGTFEATAKSYIPENVWNESCSTAQCGAQNANLSAGGGGVSVFFGKPSWQAGVAGIPSDGKRDLPDISLTAAGHDPYLICYEQSCTVNDELFGISGTSASAPAFAGIMALINQKTGERQGQANYVLYRLAAKETFSQCNGSKTTGAVGASCVFNDVTVGNNAVPGQAGFGTPAGKYQATAGYDLAIGLGSVNVNNLANQWDSVTFNSTSTTLTLNPLTVAHGDPVAVNLSVSPTGGSGTPTGTVVLQGKSGTNAIEGFALASGTFSGTSSLLPGGSYDITAHYSGDGTFGSSDSAAVSVTVTPEPSIAMLSILTADPDGNAIPFTAGPYGSFVYPRVDVVGQSGNGTPTDGVLLYDGPQFMDILYLNVEGNTAKPRGYTQFSLGTHTLTASYIGDNSFNPSDSAPASFTITQAPTSIVLTADKLTVGSTSPIALTATITTNSYGLPPQGSAAFMIGTTTIATQGLYPNTDRRTGKAFATAEVSLNSLPVGDNAINVVYAGETNYTGSTSLPVKVKALPDFSIALDKLTVNVNRGQSATVSVSITGVPEYKSTLSFTSASCTGLPRESACSFSPASVNGSGSTTLTIATTAPRTSSVAPAARTTFYALCLAGIGLFASLFLLPAANRRRGISLLTMAALACLIGWTACGGGEGGGSKGSGSSDPGTPTGPYVITVTATSGVISHVTYLNLIVQ